MRADLLVFFLIGERTLDFSIIFAVGFSKVPFIKLRKFLYVPNLLIIFFFIRNECWTLSNLFASTEIS